MRLTVVVVDGDNVDHSTSSNSSIIPSLNVSVPSPYPSTTHPVAVLRIAYRGSVRACVAGVSQQRSAPGTIRITRSFFLHCLLGLDLNSNSPVAAEAVRIALEDARCGRIYCHVELPAHEHDHCVSHIEVAPVDPDDYELLCMYSDQVSDIALAQVHVLSLGQRFPLVLDTSAHVSVVLQVVSIGSSKTKELVDGDMPPYAWLENRSEIIVLTSLDEGLGQVQQNSGSEKAVQKEHHALDGVEALVVKLCKNSTDDRKSLGNHGFINIPCKCGNSRSSSESLWRVETAFSSLQFVIRIKCCNREECVRDCFSDINGGFTLSVVPPLTVDETIMMNIGFMFPDYSSFSLVRLHEKDIYIDTKLDVVSIYILNNSETLEMVNEALTEKKLTVVDLFGRWLQCQCMNGNGFLTTLGNCVADLTDSDLFESRLGFHVLLVFNGYLQSASYSSCIQLSPQSVHSGTQFHVEDLKGQGGSIPVNQLAIYNSPYFVCANPSFFDKDVLEESPKYALDVYCISSLPHIEKIVSVLRQNVGHSIFGGITICGKCGVGKTHVLHCLHHFVLNDLHCFSLMVSCRSLIHGTNSTMPLNVNEKTRITNKFRMIMFVIALCARNASNGSVLFLDDFDVIFEETSANQNGTSLKYASMFNEAFNWLRKYHPNVTVVVTCKNIDFKLPFFSSLSLFSHHFEITPSLYQPLFLLLSVCHFETCKLVSDHGTEITCEDFHEKDDELFMKCERLMKSLIPLDVVNLVSLVRDKEDNVTFRSVIECLENHHLTRYGSVNSDSSASSEGSDSRIGGYKNVLDELKRLVEVPLMFNTLFTEDESQRKTRQMLKLNKGILLYGPPGCGKTFIVHNLARSLHLNLVTVKGPQLLSKFIGQSEAAVRDIFAKAADSQPSLLFFDEFDALAPRRGHDSTGVTDRVVNQLLTLLDGVDGGTSNSDNNSVVIIVAATNRPDLIDLALLRPGRIETKLYVGYPESEEDVRGVLDAILDVYPVYKNLLGQTVCDKMCEHAWKCHLSPADIRQAVHTAVTAIVKRILSSRQSKRSEDSSTIQGECFSRRNPQGIATRRMIDVSSSSIHVNHSQPEDGSSSLNSIKPEIVEEEFVKAMCKTTSSLPQSERIKYQHIYSSFSGRSDLLIPSSPSGSISETQINDGEGYIRITVPSQRQTLA